MVALIRRWVKMSYRTFHRSSRNFFCTIAYVIKLRVDFGVSVKHFLRFLFAKLSRGLCVHVSTATEEAWPPMWVWKVCTTAARGSAQLLKSFCDYSQVQAPLGGLTLLPQTHSWSKGDMHECLCGAPYSGILAVPRWLFVFSFVQLMVSSVCLSVCLLNIYVFNIQNLNVEFQS